MKLEGKWRGFINSESPEGWWDFFNVEGELWISRFKEGETESFQEIKMTELEWLDLIALIKRIG